MFGLARDQRLWMTSAIEQEIGGEISRDVISHRLRSIHDGIDNAVGKSGHRHAQGIDRLLLCRPFASNHIRDLVRRDGDNASRGCSDWLAVKPDGKSAVCLDDVNNGIKALALRC